MPQARVTQALSAVPAGVVDESTCLNHPVGERQQRVTVSIDRALPVGRRPPDDGQHLDARVQELRVAKWQGSWEDVNDALEILRFLDYGAIDGNGWRIEYEGRVRVRGS